MNAGSASLLIAAVDLKMTQTLIKALDARAPGLPSGGGMVTPAARYEPRQVLNPTPRYLPRTVLHPTPRFLPRPVLHPTPRQAHPMLPPCQELKSNPTPWPFPPTWKLLPPPHPHSPVQILKINPPRIDILNKGTLVDLFI